MTDHPRTHVFLFDGTMNGHDDEHPTNIRKLFPAMRTVEQQPFYFPGPGNEDENGLFMELLGGAFGLGSTDIRDAALGVLDACWQPGDLIAVLGFSRGAAIARMFCAAGEKPVCFLGCFDTVGAFLPRGSTRARRLFHDLNVASSVERAAHAVALDEDRKAFEPDLMNRRDGITEVWFPGVHCDVGGGYAETGHSDNALLWMVDEMAKAGINAKIDLYPNPAAPVGVNSGLFRREPRRVGVKVNGDWSGLEAVRV